jgi:hypothetical protein
MGIWSVDGFDSDDALDWLQGLDPGAGAEPVVRALRVAVDSPDPHLDTRRAQVALAAAELVAALHGRPHPELPEPALKWLALQTDPPLGADGSKDLDALVLATRALDYVVTSSELAELWSQQVDHRPWQAALDDLRMRLAEAGSSGHETGAEESKY